MITFYYFSVNKGLYEPVMIAQYYELTLQVTLFILLLVLGELFGVAVLVIFVHIVPISIRTLGLK